MDFLSGLMGAIAALILFVAGMAVERMRVDHEWERSQKVTAQKLTAEQEHKIKEEQEAWQALHNYTLETAYGMDSMPSTTSKE